MNFKRTRKAGRGASALLLAMAMSSLSGAAFASTCPAYPYALVNNTTADATQVMGNFGAILTCANSTILLDAQLHGQSSANLPATSGSNDPSMTTRVYATNVGSAGYGMDFGISNVSGTNWLQARKSNDFSTNAALLINPNCGNVGIASTSPSLTFYVNGTAGGTSAWTNTSDARLKKNIVPISGALSIIEQLQGVRFDWRAPDERKVGKDLKLAVGKPQVGFVAQDVQKVLPEAVRVSDGNEALLSVSESKVVPVLVEAVKDRPPKSRAWKTGLPNSSSSGRQAVRWAFSRQRRDDRVQQLTG